MDPTGVPLFGYGEDIDQIKTKKKLKYFYNTNGHINKNEFTSNATLSKKELKQRKERKQFLAKGFIITWRNFICILEFHYSGISDFGLSW